jgi:hypothetical protein
MNAPIITPNGCKNCGHSQVVGTLVCTLNPPTACPVLGADAQGRIAPVGWCSSFPPVAPDTKCGQWKLRLVVATTVERAMS